MTEESDIEFLTQLNERYNEIETKRLDGIAALIESGAPFPKVHEPFGPFNYKNWVKAFEFLKGIGRGRVLGE